MLPQPPVRWRRGPAPWWVGDQGALALPVAGAVMLAELSPAAHQVSIARAGGAGPTEPCVCVPP